MDVLRRLVERGYRGGATPARARRTVPLRRQQLAAKSRWRRDPSPRVRAWCSERPGVRMVARGETKSTSDVDLLVEMEPGWSLLDFVGFWQDLEDLLGGQVDLVSEAGISPYLRDAILAEAIAL